MFQDIEPHTLTYDPNQGGPRDADHILFLKNGLALLDSRHGTLALPRYGEFRQVLRDGPQSLIYLFSVAGTAFYHSPDAPEERAAFAYGNIRQVRTLKPALLAFAAATAFHLAAWYHRNRYCGQCAGPLLPKEKERALSCPGCGLVKYPAIAPVVIVGVRDGESLLLARNAGGEYRGYGLIAGFVEPGETLEAAIAREVMEEVGLKVSNARYYKSQPWAFSQSLLMGFFADLQGDAAITLDTGELSDAGWFPRGEIPPGESRFSLTWDMIEAFRNNEA